MKFFVIKLVWFENKKNTINFVTKIFYETIKYKISIVLIELCTTMDVLSPWVAR
jgi:hypothetical protein